MLVKVNLASSETIEKEFNDLNIAIIDKIKKRSIIIFKIESVCQETADYIKNIEGVISVELEENEEYSVCTHEDKKVITLVGFDFTRVVSTN